MVIGEVRHFGTNLVNVVQKLLKSIHICKCCRKKFADTFLWTTVYMPVF